MILLLAGIVIFFAVHSVSIVSAGWRDGMVARMGELPWKLVYSVVSLVGLVLMIKGYGAARIDPTLLYVAPAWLRTATFVLMIPVFVLLLAAYLPGRIKAKVKNPMLLAVKLWAVSHLLVNGMLADLLLFGAFLAWAVVDLISVKRRAPRAVPALPATPVNDAIAVVGGLGLYAAFAVWLHPLLIGVAVAG